MLPRQEFAAGEPVLTGPPGRRTTQEPTFKRLLLLGNHQVPSRIHNTYLLIKHGKYVARQPEGAKLEGLGSWRPDAGGTSQWRAAADGESPGWA